MIDTDEVTVAVEQGAYCKRAVRLMMIARDLASGDGCTVETLATRFGVTTRAIYRDFKTLQGEPWNLRLVNESVFGIPQGESARVEAAERILAKEAKREHARMMPKQRKANPRDEARAYALRERALRAGADGAWYTTAEHIQGRWELWGGRCYVCGAEAEAIDHVIPLARGGSHWPANLRPICGSCNSRKGAKWPYLPVKEG